MRGVCDAGKVRVVCVRTWTCSKSLEACEDSPQCSVTLFKCWGIL